MNNSIETNLLEIHAMLKEGKFIKAMTDHLHDDVELREANADPKIGKEACIAFEVDFIENQLEEFIRYDSGNYAINGNHSFYEATMELKLKDGSTMLVEQIVATEWKDGKIFRERYYHA